MKKSAILAFLMSFICLVSLGCKAQETPKAKTVSNLKAAITGETTATEKYAAFAKKAKEEGFPKIALLFQAASKSESFHAAKHKAVLEKLGEKMDAFTPKFEVKSTKENLEAAIKGEAYETDSMYPDFIKVAAEAKLDDAVMSFDAAFQVEKIHLVFYKNALEALGKKDFKAMSATWAVCPICGNTFDKNVPAKCPICGAAKATFVTIK